jgi:hypothetical protein
MGPAVQQRLRALVRALHRIRLLVDRRVSALRVRRPAVPSATDHGASRKSESAGGPLPDHPGLPGGLLPVDRRLRSLPPDAVRRLAHHGVHRPDATRAELGLLVVGALFDARHGLLALDHRGIPLGNVGRPRAQRTDCLPAAFRAADLARTPASAGAAALGHVPTTPPLPPGADAERSRLVLPPGARRWLIFAIVWGSIVLVGQIAVQAVVAGRNYSTSFRQYNSVVNDFNDSRSAIENAVADTQRCPSVQCVRPSHLAAARSLEKFDSDLKTMNLSCTATRPAHVVESAIPPERHEQPVGRRADEQPRSLPCRLGPQDDAIEPITGCD